MQHSEENLHGHSSEVDHEGLGGKQGHHHQRRQTHPRKSVVVMNAAEQHRLRQVRPHSPYVLPTYTCIHFENLFRVQLLLLQQELYVTTVVERQMPE